MGPLLKFSLQLSCSVLLIGLAPATSLFSESFFIYVDEEDENFSARYGLFDGLFKLDHIVFDDLHNRYLIEWESKDFQKLIRIAISGGAEYIVAVRINSICSVQEEGLTLIESSAVYYLIDAATEVLIAQGELTRNNRGRERELNTEELSFMLGEDLSVEIDRIYKSRL